MSKSAVSLRERRVAETSRRFTEVSRAFAIDRGLSGFTIEEVCAEVGVSRRTFFNHFASKELAVLGIRVRSVTADVEEEFALAADRPGSSPEERRTSVVDDFAELMAARWDRFTPTQDDAQQIKTLFEREPKLFQHAMEEMAHNERRDTELIERRLGLDAGDERPRILVQVVGALVRMTVFEHFQTGEVDFRASLARRIAVARSLFAPQ